MAGIQNCHLSFSINLDHCIDCFYCAGFCNLLGTPHTSYNYFFWNSHIIHHRSEEFNLACALRQSISTFLRLFTFLLIPAALLGVPSVIIATIEPIHLFTQFLYHTQHINRMGFVENILITPSHHRVHHAINKEYIDKNYSQIFIFWDKLFGTFQEELPDVQPVYSITRSVRTWNPIKINFQYLWLMIKDTWYAKSFKDKLRYLVYANWLATCGCCSEASCLQN